ncbi:MAG: alpha/beta hydrolase [Thermoplasmata archaeon]|nr:alpha/beta hydrolase [Thermoplasmata archaeon]MCI4356110.1 alpha/beta hydrolase [Thermoplasmata archaeon]
MSATSSSLPVLERGTGPTLVFLHGYPLHRAMWAPQLDGFSDAFRVVLPDLPGFGTATDYPVPDTLAGYGEAVAKTIESHVGGRATVVAHSFGGYIALQMYRDRPDLFEGLVLVSTRSEADAPEVRQKRLATAERLGNPSERLDVDATARPLVSETSRSDRPRVVAAVRAIVAAAPNPAIVGALRAIANRPDLTPVLSGIRVPTLVVWGAQDELIPPARTQALRDAVVGSEGIEVAGAGHLSPLEDPSMFDRGVRGFLAGAAARRTR